jgi:hypothetical protein
MALQHRCGRRARRRVGLPLGLSSPGLRLTGGRPAPQNRRLSGAPRRGTCHAFTARAFSGRGTGGLCCPIRGRMRARRTAGRFTSGALAPAVMECRATCSCPLSSLCTLTSFSLTGRPQEPVSLCRSSVMCAFVCMIANCLSSWLGVDSIVSSACTPEPGTPARSIAIPVRLLSALSLPAPLVPVG